MTDQEKIIAEIERLKKELYKQQDFRIDGSPIPVFDINATEGMLKILEEIKGFINSLPTEQPSEDLEEAAKENLPNAPYNVMQDNLGGYVGVYGQSKMLDMFMSGAQWQKEKTINKASQWLNENVVEYHPRKGELRPIVNINAFREAMEKEDEQ